MTFLPKLGVTIVTFNSADVILDCLESLLASTNVALDIVVVDNRSTDDTAAILKNWAQARSTYSVPTDCPFSLEQAAPNVAFNLQSGEVLATSDTECAHQIRLIQTEINGGFAAGVNAGLATLMHQSELDRVWILNPDSMVAQKTGHALATFTPPELAFSLMGGRVLYFDDPDIIQIDGGRINKRTGVTGNWHLGQRQQDVSQPQASALDFITGASMVVSRAFYEAVGPMREDYFLYYEEVDWALRRGDLPLAYCPGALVYHRAGTAIGSATLGRPASPFSLYFKHRARLRFVRRHFPRAVPTALAYSCAKAAQLAVKGYLTEAWTILYASFGRPPSKAITARLGPEAAALLATFDARK